MRSIYEQICAEYAGNKTLPYSFMPRDAGMEDLSTLLGEQMPLSLRNECARESCDGLFFDGKISVAAVVWYACEFRERVEALVEAGVIGLERVREVGLRCATTAQTAGETELGILLLGFSFDDIASMIVERFALHSNFTMVSIIASARWPDRGKRLFRWLKKTGGYGRTICALKMIPLALEQKKWLFLHVWENVEPRKIMAAHFLRQSDLAEFIRNLPVDGKNFHAFSRLIGYAFLAGTLEAFSEHRSLCLRYVEATACADRFVDLFALHAVCRVLTNEEDEECLTALERCREIQKKLVSRGTVDAELSRPSEDCEMLVGLLDAEGIMPPFEMLLPVITSQELPRCMLQFLLKSNSRDYPTELLRWIQHAWPAEVFEGGPVAGEWTQFPDGRFDFWLAETLEAMKGRDSLPEPFLLRCVQARAREVRESALKCLRAMRKTWTAAVEPTLMDLLEREPDDGVAKRIRRILGLSQGRKQQRYVDVSDLNIEAIKNTRGFDVAMETVIAGAWFRDLSTVDGLVEEGDVLLLMREPDNIHDENAIMVLAEDGYMLGYIPRADNPAIAERMDRGEFFFAILNEQLHTNRPSIYVVRPHGQDMRRKLAENVVPFPPYPGMGG